VREAKLNGTWQLRAIDTGADYGECRDLVTQLIKQPIDATVPGNVELDLMRDGLVPDLFVGRNVLLAANLEGLDWEYRHTFTTPEDAACRTATLRFDGVDCFSTVQLNGEVVGYTDNMLLPYRFEASDALAPPGEENELVVAISSATREAAGLPYDPIVQALPANYEQLRVRKAPHMYGWDIAPRIVSAGIWRSVALELHDPIEIGDVYYATRWAGPDDAHLAIHWQLRLEDAAPDAWRECELRFRGQCGDSVFEHVAPCRFVVGNAGVSVGSPKLWWPKGYGEASLYDVTCQLVCDGEVIDERTDRVGLRSIQLERTDTTTTDQPGQFMFRVNGTPILCKGSNWVPVDAMHCRDAERVPQILDLFDDLGCNMLRCWGGNVYEDHPFYDRCDERGIMVWQDFTMACARYPQDEDFLFALREEAEAIVCRLRNHPCIALWAGDNECDESWNGAGLDPQGNRTTREVLPQVVTRCDPWRTYLPSSPYIAPKIFAAGDRSLMPEQHLWGPRDYYKSSFYTEATAHFVSEIGYHGAPCIGSLEQFLSADQLWPWRDNDEWRIHAADTWPQPGPYAYRVELMAKQIHEMFGFDPDSLEDFVLASQICQAEAKKFFVEMTRLKKWRMTGVLWWNVMDCWPQFSDAIVDYYFRRKLAYAYLKRVQQPACIMMGEPESWVSRVMLGNDSRDAVSGEFCIRDADTDEVLLEGPTSTGPSENRTLGTVRASRGSQRLFLIEWTLNGQPGRNHYLLGTPPFDLEHYRAWLGKLGIEDVGKLIREGV